MMNRPFLLRGVKEISAAAGINRNLFLQYVQEKGLPAWRHDGGGTWLALREDLETWIRQQRDLNLNSAYRHGAGGHNAGGNE